MALALVPRAALAHAQIVESAPAAGAVLAAPPPAVALRFSEPVSPVGRGISVLAPSGRQVARGSALRSGAAQLSVPVDAAEDGTYTVRWQVVASDTHPARGEFQFAVGHASIAATPAGATEVGSVSALGLALQSLARWAHFAGYALAFGALLFMALVEAAPRLWRLVGAGIVLLLVAEPLALVAQSASIAPGLTLDPQTLGDVMASSFGHVFGLRLGAALLLWALVGAVRQAPTAGIWPLLALGGALALVDGSAAHTVPVAAPWLGIAVNGLHVAAMGAWAGGVASLLVILPAAGSRELLVARFGHLARVSLAVLVASGLVLAVAHIDSPAALLATAYGRVLLGKVGLAGAAIGLAWSGLRAPECAWRLEALALAALLGTAGLLLSLPPPI